MVTVPQHYLARVGGALYGDARWSIGVRLGQIGSNPVTGPSSAAVTASLDAWRDNIAQISSGKILVGQMQLLLGAQATVDTVRCSLIGTDGKENAVSLLQKNPAVSYNGTGSHPAQVAVCCSLQTARPGASYRGRLYMPAIAANIVQGRLDSTQASSLSSDVASWLHQVAVAGADLNGKSSDHPWVPIVLSTTKGVVTQVTSVRVGNRLDSQRRRAESQEESYSVANVPQ